MELRQLRYYREVASVLSFSRAAERLHIAQPALSRQIKSLENELGVVLLARSRVRVELTDAGRLFLSHSEKVLAQVDMAVSAVQDVPQGDEGHLVLCMEWKLRLPQLTDALAVFRRNHPRVNMELKELAIMQHHAQVATGKAHLGLAARDFVNGNKSLSFYPLLQTESVVLMSVHHPLAKKEHLTLRDFREESWIWGQPHEGDDSYRKIPSQQCRAAGFTPRYGKSARTIEGILGLVETNYGVTLIPNAVLGDQLSPGLRIVRLKDAPIELGLIWKTHPKSKLVSNLIRLLKQRET